MAARGRKRPMPPEEPGSLPVATAGAAVVAATAPKKRGRPKGSPNLRLQDGEGAAAAASPLVGPTFEEMLYQLILYKSEHGTCTVPKIYDGHRNLGKWASELRTEHLRKGSRAPTAEQVTVLRTVGFPLLSPSEQVFEDRLRELRAFKEQHGHCQVPTAKAGALGRWVNQQRIAYNSRSKGVPKSPSAYVLTQSRIDALDALGFVWKIREHTSFDDRLEELKAYKAAHGHTRVPQHYAENKPLGKWVTKQRYCYNLKMCGEQSQLTDERIGMLNAIGFEWNVMKKRRHPAEGAEGASASAEDASAGAEGASAGTEGASAAQTL